MRVGGGGACRRRSNWIGSYTCICIYVYNYEYIRTPLPAAVAGMSMMERDGGVNLRTEGGGRLPMWVAYIHMAASFSLFTYTKRIQCLIEI